MEFQSPLSIASCRFLGKVHPLDSRSLLLEQTKDDEGLTPLMCEVESILNNRPITVGSEDSRDLEPLTPNHLLLLG